MKSFKALTLLSVIFLTQSAFASESCKNLNGDTLNIGYHWRQGITAALNSKAVGAYYQKNHGLDASALETVIDPSTRKYDSEQTNNGYRFTMMVPESEVNSIWNLVVSFKGTKAKAQLVDMEGITFEFDFNCVTGPDLE